MSCAHKFLDSPDAADKIMDVMKHLRSACTILADKEMCPGCSVEMLVMLLLRSAKDEAGLPCENASMAIINAFNSAYEGESKIVAEDEEEEEEDKLSVAAQVLH